MIKHYIRKLQNRCPYCGWALELQGYTKANCPEPYCNYEIEWLAGNPARYGEEWKYKQKMKKWAYKNENHHNTNV